MLPANMFEDPQLRALCEIPSFTIPQVIKAPKRVDDRHVRERQQPPDEGDLIQAERDDEALSDDQASRERVEDFDAVGFRVLCLEGSVF
jgi:hypothetical protein